MSEPITATGQLYFFERRTRFIREFHKTASAPFIEKKRKIDVGEDPFVPPYSEDPEPPFLGEWMEADEMLGIVGQTSVSMLSSALGLYLISQRHQLSDWYPEAQARIKSLGGTVSGSVSGKTDYLVVGADPGSKLAQAEKHGVEQLDEEAFLALLERS